MTASASRARAPAAAMAVAVAKLQSLDAEVKSALDSALPNTCMVEYSEKWREIAVHFVLYCTIYRQFPRRIFGDAACF